MVKLILCILLIAQSFIAFAQAKDSAAVFTVQSRSAYNEIGSVVAPVKMNVLYIGIENPIDIAVPSVAAKDITAEIMDGKIEKLSDGHFIAMVTSVGKTLIIVRVKGKEVSRNEFRIKRIPNPIVTLNGIMGGGNVRTETFKKVSGINPLYPNLDIDALFTVKSYRVIFQHGMDQQAVEGTSALFSKEILKLIEQLKVGDKVIFTDVVVTGPDLQIRKLEEATFTLI